MLLAIGGEKAQLWENHQDLKEVQEESKKSLQ